jgi:hypothetical protein
MWSLRVRYCMAALRGGAAIAMLCIGPTMDEREENRWVPSVVGAMFMLGALLLPLDRKTLIDPAAGTVTSEGRWFGRLLWCEPRRLSDFVAITYHRASGSDSDGGSASHDVVWVCLQPKRGRPVAVEYFWSEGQGGPCAGAVVCAYDLARKTGLQIIPEGKLRKG